MNSKANSKLVEAFSTKFSSMSLFKINNIETKLNLYNIKIFLCNMPATKISYFFKRINKRITDTNKYYDKRILNLYNSSTNSKLTSIDKIQCNKHELSSALNKLVSKYKDLKNINEDNKNMSNKSKNELYENILLDYLTETINNLYTLLDRQDYLSFEKDKIELISLFSFFSFELNKYLYLKDFLLSEFELALMNHSKVSEHLLRAYKNGILFNGVISDEVIFILMKSSLNLSVIKEKKEAYDFSVYINKLLKFKEIEERYVKISPKNSSTSSSTINASSSANASDSSSSKETYNESKDKYSNLHSKLLYDEIKLIEIHNYYKITLSYFTYIKSLQSEISSIIINLKDPKTINSLYSNYFEALSFLKNLLVIFEHKCGEFKYFKENLHLLSNDYKEFNKENYRRLFDEVNNHNKASLKELNIETKSYYNLSSSIYEILLIYNALSYFEANLIKTKEENLIKENTMNTDSVPLFNKIKICKNKDKDKKSNSNTDIANIYNSPLIFNSNFSKEYQIILNNSNSLYLINSFYNLHNLTMLKEKTLEHLELLNTCNNNNSAVFLSPLLNLIEFLNISELNNTSKSEYFKEILRRYLQINNDLFKSVNPTNYFDNILRITPKLINNGKNYFSYIDKNLSRCIEYYEYKNKFGNNTSPSEDDDVVVSPELKGILKASKLVNVSDKKDFISSSDLKYNLDYRLGQAYYYKFLVSNDQLKIAGYGIKSISHFKKEIGAKSEMIEGINNLLNKLSQNNNI